ncbi:MAG: hypothetical protein QXD04_03565, partial [Candidatus Bathyarchaeia archaeon]
NPDRVESLKPEGEDFIEIGYSLTPLPQLLNGILLTAEEFERLAKQRDEYRLLAQRMRREAEELRMSLEHQCDERIKQLEETIGKLKETSKTQAKTIYRLKLKARDYAAQAEELAPLLSEEAEENLRFRLEALKEHLLF